MAKIRRIPRAFQDTKGIPGQYTTDPAVAPPAQIESIGKAYDKAKRISKGQQLFEPLGGGKPLVTSLSEPATQYSAFIRLWDDGYGWQHWTASQPCWSQWMRIENNQAVWYNHE